MDRGRGPGPEHDFRWRGTEVSRLEALSDAVFALALALVLLSGDVPTRISELRATFQQIVPFAICFSIIGMIWHGHYLFFRRYGLRDGHAALLNAVLLFLVLLFAYPLKLLFGLVSQLMFGVGAPRPLPELLDDDFPMLQAYSAGFGAIYLVFVLLYRHAYRQRAALELDEIERGITRQYEQAAWCMVAFAVASILLATFLPPHLRSLGGWVYFGIGPAMFVLQWRWAVWRARMR